MKIRIKYFALLKDTTNCPSEEVETKSKTVKELYGEINDRYQFPISSDLIRFAINDEYVSAETRLIEGDTVVFISPIAGG